MCARLLACPLCSQPGFLTLDALRAGLVSVATRPLACPVCNEVLLGVDKLTIHLFSHSINKCSNEPPKIINVAQNVNVCAMVRNVENIPLQAWNILKPIESREITEIVGKNQSFVSLQKAEQTNTGVVPKTTSSQLIYLQPEQVYIEPRNSENYREPTDDIATSVEERANFQTNETGKSVEKNIEQNIVWAENPSSSPTLSQFSLLVDYQHISGEETLKNQQAPTNAKASSDTEMPNGFKLIAMKQNTERCDVCETHFPDGNILELHKQVVHATNKKDLNHLEHFLKNYPCTLCSKVFKMRGSLMVHMRVAHAGYNPGSSPKHTDLSPTSTENGFNCPTCGKNFKKEQHVMQHLKTHDGKQWECDVCCKMFTTKYFLKKHKRLHSGEMPYKCNICDKTFTFQQSYHKHRLYHKDDKPHACSTCGRSFKELSTLHNHERIHTGEKPFACETCGKCFRQRVSYLVHRRIHTGVMPYKCTACGKSFRYKVSQRTHKCPVQPPGTVVQDSETLVQRLLQNSERKNARDETVRDSEVAPSDAQNSMQNISLNLEDNKYVLIVNDQGRHILTRQTNAESNSKAEEKMKGSKELWPDVGGNNEETFEKEQRMDYKKSTINQNQDFFSMVMSPLNEDLSSPSTEMEHLRLSSPVNHENVSELTDDFMTSSNALEMIREENNVERSYRNSEPLQTINEESLKELLYGISSK